jgi:hypothetical protein
MEDDISVLQKKADRLFEITKQMQRQGPSASPVEIRDPPVDETPKSTTHHSNSQLHPKRTQAQFIGPTSSAFGFSIAHSTLNSMGLQVDLPDGDAPMDDSALPTRSNTPEFQRGHSRSSDILCSIPIPEILRLLQVYKDEVGAVYPFIDVADYVGQAHVLHRSLRDAPNHSPLDNGNQISTVDNKDVRLLKMMVAIALVLEGLGQSTLGQELADSVAFAIGRSAREVDIDFKELQILTISVCYIVSVPPIFLVEDDSKTVRVYIISIATKRCWLGGLLGLPPGWP